MPLIVALLLLLTVTACNQSSSIPLDNVFYEERSGARHGVTAETLDAVSVPVFGEDEAAADRNDLQTKGLESEAYETYLPLPLPRRTGAASPPSRRGDVVRFDVQTRTERVETAPGEVAYHAETSSGDSDDLRSALSELARAQSSPSLVADPTQSPNAKHVKVFLTRQERGGDITYWACSGTLIDPRWVLTAGHCLYDHDSGYNVETTVVPGYGEGTAPWGGAVAAQLYVWGGWREARDFDWDVGWIRLERPIGALTGWRGYGASDRCAFFTEGAFGYLSYPAAPASPFNGENMVEDVSTFGGCESNPDGTWYGNEVWSERSSYGGESGAGATESGVVWAVLSNGKFGRTWDARLTRSMVTWTDETITRATPDAADLHALDVRVAEGAQAGTRSLSYLVHNYGASSVSGPVIGTVYLSANDTISTADLALSSHTFEWTFNPISSVRVEVPALELPACSEGNYYLGVILTTPDAETRNNRASGPDAAKVSLVQPETCR